MHIDKQKQMLRFVDHKGQGVNEMEKNYELEINGKIYLLFDAVEYNGCIYYSAVELDDKKNETTNYQYFRKYEKIVFNTIDIPAFGTRRSELYSHLRE